MDADVLARAKELSQRCFDSALEVRRIVHLAVMCGENMDDLIDYVVDQIPVLAEAAGVDEQTLRAQIDQFGTRDRERAEAFNELVQWRPLLGWLVEVGVPEFKPCSPGSRMVTHGWTRLRGFYGDTYEQALHAALDWADSELETAMAAAR